MIGLEDRVDRVAGGAGQVVHDHPLLADQAVEQGRLADVGPADERHREHLLAVVGGELGLVLGFGQQLDQGVEQVAGPEAVQRADRVRLTEAEREQLPHERLARRVVDLVGQHQDRLITAPEELRDPGVLLGDAGRHVGDEQHDVGLVHGPLALTAHLLVEHGAAGHPTAGVDEAELGPLPLGVDLLAVAGDARLLLDDRGPVADDAVQQGGLAHVGAAHDGDHGQLGHGGSLLRLRARPAGRHRRWGRPRRVAAGRRRSCRRGTGRPTGRRPGRRYRWPSGSAARVRARSAPTSRPVTEVVPPKNWLSTGTSRTSERSTSARRGRSTAAPAVPVRIPTGTPPKAEPAPQPHLRSGADRTRSDPGGAELVERP